MDKTAAFSVKKKHSANKPSAKKPVRDKPRPPRRKSLIERTKLAEKQKRAWTLGILHIMWKTFFNPKWALANGVAAGGKHDSYKPSHSVKAMFTWFDKDNSKQIDYAEFRARLLVLDIKLEKQQLQTLFKVFDLSGNGFVSLSNFEGAFSKYKKALEDKQVPELGKGYSSFGGKKGGAGWGKRKRSNGKGKNWHYRSGDLVEIVGGGTEAGGGYRQGKVGAVHSDGTYDVGYEDGGHENDVDGYRMRRTLQVGDLIEAQEKDTGEWRPGKVAEVNKDGLCHIDYYDGDSEIDVDRTRLRERFRAGDAVEADYEGSGTWLPGEVNAVNEDGTYKIQYNNGEVEDNVEPECVRVGTISRGRSQDGRAGKAGKRGRAKGGRRGNIGRNSSGSIYDGDEDEGAGCNHGGRWKDGLEVDTGGSASSVRFPAVKDAEPRSPHSPHSPHSPRPLERISSHARLLRNQENKFKLLDAEVERARMVGDKVRQSIHEEKDRLQAERLKRRTTLKRTASSRFLSDGNQRLTQSGMLPRLSSPEKRQQLAAALSEKQQLEQQMAAAARFIQRVYRSYFFIKYCKTAAKRKRMLYLKQLQAQRLTSNTGFVPRASSKEPKTNDLCKARSTQEWQ